MTPDIHDLMRIVLPKRPRGLVVDTNLLLLYFVGSCDRTAIAFYPKTSKYSEEDFDVVRKLIEGLSGRVITSPCILAELGNLSPQHGNKRFAAYFAGLVNVLGKWGEDYQGKDVVLSSGFVPTIGFSDVSIMQMVKAGGYVLLTDDFRATGILRSEGCLVLNLADLRS